MAFVAEDGSGLSTATSLVSLAAANAYWADRPRRAEGRWADATDAEKEESLMRATQFLNGEVLLGSPISSDQACVLPRYFPDSIGGVYYADGMPQPILDACCELANEDLASMLEPSRDRGGAVISETIGPLSFTYSDGAPSGTTYPLVERLIGPFRAIGSGQSELVLS